MRKDTIHKRLRKQIKIVPNSSLQTIKFGEATLVVENGLFLLTTPKGSVSGEVEMRKEYPLFTTGQAVVIINTNLGFEIIHNHDIKFDNKAGGAAPRIEKGGQNELWNND